MAGLYQIFMDGQIGIHRVGLGDNKQVAPARQLQGHTRERFQRPRLTGADLAGAFGNGAHLATLRRLMSGKFDVADAIKLDDVLKLTTTDLEKKVVPFLKLAQT